MLALENRSWGYTRIHGALANVGHHVGRGTIANILREQGIDPAPERGKRTSWSTFLKAHWESIAATDFFTVEVVTLRGLVTHYVLFFLGLASRTVKIAALHRIHAKRGCCRWCAISPIPTSRSCGARDS
jgi:putative transposase